MLLWFVSGQSTSVMLRNKSSILDVVCHVATCLVTQLAGTLLCATGRSLRHISTSLANNVERSMVIQLEALPDVRETHPVSCLTGTGSLLGLKRAKRGANHPPSFAPKLKTG